LVGYVAVGGWTRPTLADVVTLPYGSHVWFTPWFQDVAPCGSRALPVGVATFTDLGLVALQNLTPHAGAPQFCPHTLVLPFGLVDITPFAVIATFTHVGYLTPF